MLDPKAPVIRAVSLVFSLALPLPVLAQPAPEKRPPARADAAPAEAFDIERAIVSDTGGLTADEAAKRARARAPQIQSAEAASAAAEWEAKSAWVGFIPQLSLFAQYKRISEVRNSLGGTDPDAAARLAAAVAAIPDPATRNAFGALGDSLSAGFGDANFTQPLNNYALGAGLKIPVSTMLLQTLPQHEAAKEQIEVRRLQAQSTAEIVELQAREVFYRYAAAVAQRALVEQAVKQSEAQAAQTKLFVDAGTKAPVEHMAATAQLEGLRGELARAEGALAATRNALATLMGVSSAEVQAIGEHVTQLPEAPTQAPEAMVDHAIEHRTELLALRKAVGATRKVQKAQKNAVWPQLNLEGNTLYANPNPRYIPVQEEFNNTWDVSATLSWSPTQAFAGTYAGNKAGADAAKARADLAAMEDSVRIEVIEAFENFKAAAATARAGEAEVKAAEETYRVRLATYKVGAGVMIDLTDAESRLNQARLKYVASAIQARLYLAQLRRRAAIE
jgi:outer membrane protein